MLLLLVPARRTCTKKLSGKHVQSAGINPYMVEIANLREHCSWIHDDIPSATEKAIDLLRFAVERVKFNEAIDSD